MYNNTQEIQDKIKIIFYQRTKVEDFQASDLVLRWDDRNEIKVNMGNLKTFARDHSRL